MTEVVNQIIDVVRHITRDNAEIVDIANTTNSPRQFINHNNPSMRVGVVTNTFLQENIASGNLAKIITMVRYMEQGNYAIVLINYPTCINGDMTTPSCILHADHDDKSKGKNACAAARIDNTGQYIYEPDTLSHSTCSGDDAVMEIIVGMTGKFHHFITEDIVLKSTMMQRQITIPEDFFEHRPLLGAEVFYSTAPNTGVVFQINSIGEIYNAEDALFSEYIKSLAQIISQIRIEYARLPMFSSMSPREQGLINADKRKMRIEKNIAKRYLGMTVSPTNVSRPRYASSRQG